MKVEIRCPICSKMGVVEISDEVFKNISRGLLAVNVTDNTICPHSFNLYIDKNLNIRDYFIADIQIKTPEMVLDKESESRVSSSAKDFDLDLIKITLLPQTMAYMIRAISFGKKICLILDEDHLHNHIIKFLEFITQNSFNFMYKLITRQEYKNQKKEFSDYLVLENNKIIKDKEKILDPKSMVIERKITQKFFAEYDSDSSLMGLKNEIQKLSILSTSIGQFIKNSKEKKKIDIIKITNHLEELYNFKISTIYTDYLLLIVEKYHGIPIPKSLKNVSKLLSGISLF
ncbi:MAG: hypothetical protein EU539_00070 [Promethearchaeota archaeon]|nr:MAG: hypothetical protein EU539_00070 [Candidatus Lokiarchaeota archaeon]